MKKIFLFLFIFISRALLFGQTPSFSGKITDEHRKPLADVNVCIVDSGGHTLVYDFSKENGEFTLPNTSDKGQYITMSLLGRKSLKIPLREFHNHASFMMVTNSIQLHEVKVRSQRVRVAGDTVTYSVRGYRMPQDRSIADVLKKIPGLEVMSSGQIKYDDKAISHLYIEGADLMGGQYALATNNISNKVVKSVQILKNHQDINALKGKSFSEQTAINLTLEDNVKSVITGMAEGAAGMNANKNAEGNARILAMWIGKKQQDLSLLKFNNTGNFSDEELKDHVANRDGLKDAELESVINTPSTTIPGLDGERYRDSREYLAATNHLYKFNKWTTLRSQINYLNASEDYHDNSETTYFYPDNIWRISESNRIIRKDRQFHASMDLNHNGNRIFVEDKLSGFYIPDKTFNNMLTNASLIDNRFKNDYQSFSNLLNMVVPYGKGSFLKLNNLTSSQEKSETMTFSPGLYADLLTSGDKYDELTQNVKVRQLYTLTQAELQIKLAGFYIRLLTEAGYKRQSFQSLVSIMPEHVSFNQVPYRNDITFSALSLAGIPSLHFRNTIWAVQLKVPLRMHLFSIETTNRELKQKFSAEPYLYLSLTPGPYWTFSVSGNYELENPDIYVLYSRYVFNSYRTMVKGSGFYTYSTLAGVGSMKYSNPLKGTFIQLSGGMTPLWKDRIESLRQDGIFQIADIHYLKHEDLLWFVRGSISKSLSFWKGFTSLNIEHNVNTFKTMIENQVMPSTMTHDNIIWKYALQPARYLSFEGTEELQLIKLYNAAMADSRSQTFSSRLSLFFNLSSHWHLKWSHILTFQNKPVYSSVYFMDAAVIYSNRQLELELDGSNLLNDKDYTQTVLVDIMSGTTRYNYRPLAVRLKVSYAF